MSHKQLSPRLFDRATVPRLRFWEIEDFLICPVVGQCMRLEEQRQVLKRAKMPAKKLSRFKIHEILVSCANDENPLSTRVDALLHRKLGREAETLLRLNHDAFMERYRSAFKAGKYCAVLWAAAVHPNLPSESLREIFGEVHMAMHFSSDERMKIMHKMGTQEEKIAALDARAREAVANRRTLQKENNRLKRTTADLESKILATDREKTALASELANVLKQSNDPRGENLPLKNQLAALERELANTRRREIALTAENARLMTELDQQRKVALLFRQETRNVISRMTNFDSCNPSCPAFDLCKKRILIVGGITRMEVLYRKLIEGGGGVFDYHNGNVKNGVKQLESRLKRADIVVCPVNCNSHGACRVVKNLAKKYHKTVHMLPSASLSAVSRVIWGGEEVQASLN